MLVFATTVDHSRILTTVLRAEATMRTTSAATPRAVSEPDHSELFEVSQDPQVLCNFGVLTTGFDAPQTSAALTAYKKSLVLYSQMVGRATAGTQ